MSIQGSLPLADGMSLRIAGLGQASERFVDPSPHYSRNFCCKRGWVAATGSLAVQPFDILHEYVPGLHISKRPSSSASERFRDEPS